MYLFLHFMCDKFMNVYIHDIYMSNIDYHYIILTILTILTTLIILLSDKRVH